VSGPAGSAHVDTNIQLATPTTGYGGDASLYVGVSNAADKVYRALVAFNIANVPAGATITDCRLTLDVTQRKNPTAGHVHQLCPSHWLDGDGQSETQATWNNWRTGTPWGQPGAASTASCSANGDYSAGGIAYTPPAGPGFFTFPNLATLCQDALVNRGGWLRLRISQDVETAKNSLMRFASSDDGTPANRPRLVVTYAPSSFPTTTTTTTLAASTTTSTTSATPTTAPGSSTTSSSTVTTSSTTTTTIGSGGVNTYQAGVSGPANSANVDTNIGQTPATSNYGADPALYVGVTTAANKVFRSLLAFNIANIPAGATITDCRLTVTVTQRKNPTAGRIDRICTERWRDGDGQGEAQATWIDWQTASAWGQPGASSTADCSAGGDYATAGEVAYTAPAGTGLFTFPNLATLCQDALVNRGGWLRLRIAQNAETTKNNFIKLVSSDGTPATGRPKLSVTWSQ
jgi:hypothetical protein